MDPDGNELAPLQMGTALAEWAETPLTSAAVCKRAWKTAQIPKNRNENKKAPDFTHFVDKITIAHKKDEKTLKKTDNNHFAELLASMGHLNVNENIYNDIATISLQFYDGIVRK